MIGSFLADGYIPPGAEEVFPPEIFGQVPWFDKAILLVIISVFVISVFLWAAVRRPALVPGRMQFTGELLYNFVRNGIGRDIIGSKDYMTFVPLLFTLFTYIMVNNLWGVTPFVSFPPMAHIAFPMVLALIVLVVYNVAGIRRQGLGRYFKDVMFIPGVPAFVYPILAPIELLTILFIRPFTLTLRLFANMFAGHMLLLVFVTGAEYMIFEVSNPALKAAGLLTGVLAIVMSLFELFVELFQAYIFALLTALYISGAVNEGH
ncbi:MAG: F0F1 ATP synthase subunit A [Actinomycetia bacterium]|nr:F0F1 ATP synthase subunit A [Actinomycetes bacterium]